MKRKLMAVLVAVSSIGLAQVSGQTKPAYANALAVMDGLAKSEPPVALHRLAESDSCTVNFLAAKSEVKRHYHAKHEETVVVLRGSGTFSLAGVAHEVKMGDVMHIPRGTFHGFKPSSDDVIVVSMFSPKFDGVDRVFVDGE
jgi:quercetin dioxygenase-like cupin family protein